MALEKGRESVVILLSMVCGTLGAAWYLVILHLAGMPVQFMGATEYSVVAAVVAGIAVGVLERNPVVSFWFGFVAMVTIIYAFTHWIIKYGN